MIKLGRNDPCWCKSGKKYKQCHLGTPEDSVYWNRVSELGEFGARAFVQQEFQNVDVDRELRLLSKISEERKLGKRPKPSENVCLGKSRFSDKNRKVYIDTVAQIIDNNLTGRSTMCVYFAILLADVLRQHGFDSKAFIGKATYWSSDKKDEFFWDHAWVVVGEEIVDCNVDSMSENPKVPNSIRPVNYWGPRNKLPEDRSFVPDKEIDEKWIEENADLDGLHKWRKQLSKKYLT